MSSAYTHQSRNQSKTLILISTFILLVTVLFFLAGYVFDQIWITFFGLFISFFQAFSGYFYGDKIALAFAGGKKADEKEYPDLHNLVENISRIADIPKPKVFVSPDKSANAFACGRGPGYASLCFNQGILDILNKSELEGVVAHEIAHIKNRDTLVMTVTMVLASLIAFISDFGFRIFVFRGNDDEDNRKSPILIILYIFVLLISPFLSFLIQMGVSRSREYLADSTAVVYTRYPNGLISALQKLYSSPIPTSHYSTSMNHFYISPPKKKWGEKISGLFSTHPSIEDRIKALKEMG